MGTNRKKLRWLIPILIAFCAMLSACSSGIEDDSLLIQQGFTVKVTYDFQGGYIDTRSELLLYNIPNTPYVDPAEINKSPSRAQYIIEGWYKKVGDNIYGEKVNFETDLATENVTLYAKWQRERYFVVVYLDENGNEVRLSESRTNQNAKYLNFREDAGKREGYSLIGYYKDKAKTIPFTQDSVFDKETDPDIDSSFDYIIYSDWVKGDYTVVWDEQDLLKLTFNSNYYLITDLDFTGLNWQPFSLVNGSIVGNGHKISNITCPPVSPAGSRNLLYGMFIELRNTTITDVVFENITINIAYEGMQSLNVGLLAGQLAETVTIKGCTFSGEINLNELPTEDKTHYAGSIYGATEMGAVVVEENNNTTGVTITNNTDRGVYINGVLE